MQPGARTTDQLLSEAVAAVAAGEFAVAARAFERAGDVLIADRDAAAALVSAARLRLVLDEPAAAAALLDRAEVRARAAGELGDVLRVRAELADRGGELEVRRTAWTAAAAAGDPRQRTFALTQLGAIAQALGDPAGAARRFEEALAEMPSADPVLEAELRLELAISLTAAGDHDRAVAELDRIAAALPADAVSLGARVLGQRGVLAFARGDHRAARELAEAARAAAVGRDDAMTYLAASSLLALVYETTGDLVAAYDTFIRARESLVALLGDEARGLVQPAIDVFEHRLGREQFAVVWHGWVASRR